MSNYSAGINTVATGMANYVNQQQQMQEQGIARQRADTMQNEQHTANLLSQYIRDMQMMQDSRVKQEMEMMRLKAELEGVLGEKQSVPINQNQMVQEAAQVGYKKGQVGRQAIERADMQWGTELGLKQQGLEQQALKSQAELAMRQQGLGIQQQNLGLNQQRLQLDRDKLAFDRSQPSPRMLAEENRIETGVEKLGTNLEKTGIYDQRQRVSEIMGILDRNPEPMGTGALARTADRFGAGALTNAAISTFGSSDDKRLRGLVTELLSKKIYDASGKAVTVPEVERAQQALGMALGQGPQELRQALTDYLGIIENTEQRLLARQRPEVRERYQQRVGESRPVVGPQSKSSTPAPPREAFAYGASRRGLAELDGRRMVDETTGQTYVFDGADWVEEP